MPTDKDRQIEELKADIEVLQNENAILTERSEETALLKLIADSINLSETKEELIEHVLEKISILKDIPVCFCCDREENTALIEYGYSILSEEDYTGNHLSVSSEILTALNKKGIAAVQPDTSALRGIAFDFDFDGFIPNQGLIFSFHCRAIRHGLFVFLVSDREFGPMTPLSTLLGHVIRMVTDKLEKIELFNELKKLNTRLDLMVEQRTRSLEKTNAKLHQEIDIRKSAETEIDRLRRYLSDIIDSMPSIVIGVDPRARITLWNKKADLSLGLRKQDVEGEYLFDRIPWLNPIKKKILNCIEIQVARQFQKLKVNTADIPQYMDITVYPLTDEGIDGAVIRIDDVTDRIRLEDLMIQNEKMLSVGGLAAGMAHEINNPLTGILQNTVVLANRLGLNKEIPANHTAANAVDVSLDQIKAYMTNRNIPDMVEDIQASGKRISNIIKNMLDFARKGDTDLKPVSITDLFNQTLKLALTDLDFKQITIRKHFESPLPMVKCEPGQLQQVFLNIFSNGVQAMKTHDTHSPSFTIFFNYLSETRQIKIQIKDNGPGMPENLQKNIFEPFFTTKKPGIGTGLGLSVSYFIITKTHKGRIEVDTAPGLGSNFIIHLPIDPEPGNESDPD